MLDPALAIADLLRNDTRYHFDAYVFVSDALRYAQENLNMGSLDTSELPELDLEEEEEGAERHVTGQELCEAMRIYAHEQYGYLAKQVLNHWGIRSTGDFGEVVFNLIRIEQMRKTPQDRREDFDDVFDFDEGLQNNFQFSVPDSNEESRS